MKKRALAMKNRVYESWIIMDNAKIHNAVRNSYSLLGISFRFGATLLWGHNII
jgi:hypothetical protein